MRRRAQASGLRGEHAAFLRRLCAMPFVPSMPTCPWPAQLAALEAGERVQIAGNLLTGHPAGQFWLEADGSLTPRDPPSVDPVDPDDFRTLYERTHQ